MASILPTLLFILSFPLFTPAANSGDNNGTGGGEPPFVGVVIGDDVSGLLPPADLARFLVSQRITHVRLSNPSRSLLAALNSTGIRVLITVPNSLLLAFASSPSSASSRASRLILPFTTSISAVSVGDDFSASISASLLLPALRSPSSALSDLQSRIPISTPLPFSIINNPFPPSQAFFNQTLTPNFLLPLLAFLSSTNSPFMLNLYPYYSFMRSRGIISLDSALFKPLPPSKEEIDPNTLLHYTNLFDAMLDAARFALRSLNFSRIPIVVTETGWPSAGDPKSEPFATKDNANTYNSNLIKHVMVDRAGTLLVPEQTASVYIYELFNEDRRLGLESEKHWGLFNGNGTPVYLLNVAGTGGFLANDSTNRTFCVAAEGADMKELQATLDWACGPGRANSEIQPGEGCYDPNDVRRHASYAFDSYYHLEGKAAGSCYFQGATMVTTTDPSHGDCIFPGRNMEGFNDNSSTSMQMDKYFLNMQEDNFSIDDLSRDTHLNCDQIRAIVTTVISSVATFLFLVISTRRSLPQVDNPEGNIEHHAYLSRLYFGSDSNCVNMVRMKSQPFFKFCSLFRSKRLLVDIINVHIEEQVAMFLHTIGHNIRNRVIRFNFQRSGETISRYFNAVLYAVGQLRKEFIKPPSL